ncbi:MAG TPA: hypothetical protein VHO47_00730 [Candidatus Babeliales bacterium]|nr:hypothetical protein [Candidatus Babeliales bacterium]
MLQFSLRLSIFALIAAVSFNSQIKAEASGIDMAKAAGGLLLSGAAKYATDELSKKEAVKKFSEKTGIDAQDAGNVISISGGMLSLSLIANDKTSDGLQNLSWRAPIAAAVAGITCTRTFQNIARHVPVIGSCITCNNEECKGICDKCKLTKITIAIGVYRAVDVGLNILLPISNNP